MRTRSILALVFALSAACSSSPTAPEATALTGRWEGTFTVTSCEWTGMYKGCGQAVGSSYLAGLLFLEPSGSNVRGFGHYASYPDDLLNRQSILNGFLQQFNAPVGSDGTLQLQSRSGKSPTAVYEFQWNLKPANGRRLEGTLRARNYWYKVEGDVTYLGNVVLTKKSD